MHMLWVVKGCVHYESCLAALSVPGIADLVMPLSTEPTLGTWKIVLTRSDNSEETANFDVEEYGKRFDVEEFGKSSDVEEYGKSCDVEEYGKSCDVEEYGESCDVEKCGKSCDVEKCLAILKNGKQLKKRENFARKIGYPSLKIRYVLAA